MPLRDYKVSVYIPCYNVETTIGRCIEGLLKQTRPADEIIVIDDGSTDGTLEKVSSFPVKIVKHPINRGLGAARNSGLQEAQYDFVGCLDADTIPSEQWLEYLIRFFKISSIAMASGMLVETNTKTLADAWRATHLLQNFGGLKIKNPTLVYGNNSIVRKTAAKEVGMYSERFKTNGEDVDFYLRLRAHGHEAIYEPQALVFHLRKDTVKSILRTSWKWTCYAYEMPVTFRNNIRVMFGDHRKKMIHLIRKDWRAKRYKLIILDIAYYFNCIRQDLKMWINFRFFGKKPC